MTEYVNAYADGSHVVRVRRVGGRVVLDRVKAEHGSFFKKSELPLDLRRALEGSRSVVSCKDEGEWVRVGWQDAEVRKAACLRSKQQPGKPNPLDAVESYEADVDPVRRWLTDSDAEVAAPRRVYMDLEWDSRTNLAQAANGEARVLSWALVDESGRRRCDVLEEDADDAERALLENLWRELDAYDQVVVWQGSYGDEALDFLVLWKRSALQGIRVEPRRWLWLDHLVLFKRMNMHSAGSGAEKQSMKLEDIAQEVLGEGKTKEGGLIPDKPLGAQSWEMWAAGGVWRARLVRYNVVDTDLLRKIEAKTGYIALFDVLCRVCRVFGNNEGLNPTLQMDGFLLRLGRERGHHFVTKQYRDSEEQFRGAYVMVPKAHGIVRGVHVADFSSMYPSIIVSWNMSPDTKRAIPVNGPIPGGHTRAPTTGVGFALDAHGILVVALREMLRLRKEWSDKQASLPPGTPEWHEAGRISTAYKVAANAFYGVVGSPYSRYFDKSIAESVTQTGVWLIKATAHEAEKRGWKVIYADTDSIFVVGCTRQEFAEFVAWCNAEFYPRIVSGQGCAENLIKIAYEKEFDRIVFCGAKRYIGAYAHYKGKAATAASKPEIKGVEYKRGDAGRLARILQGEVIDMLVGGLKLAPVAVPTENLEEYHAALSRVRDHVLLDQLPAVEVLLSKSLSRPLKDYVVKTKKDGTPAAQPPHVVVAKMLKSRGRTVATGDRVEYFVVDGTTDPTRVAPAEDYVGECDRYSLWESTVFPPTRRLLESAFPGHDWASWGKVRPKKPRTKRQAAEKAGQMSLMGDLESLAVAPSRRTPAA